MPGRAIARWAWQDRARKSSGDGSRSQLGGSPREEDSQRVAARKASRIPVRDTSVFGVVR
jgi:hypothetical protein